MTTRGFELSEIRRIVFVVDGEVAFKIPVQTIFEQMVAAMSSDPKVIKLSNNDKLSVVEGWTYDGENFLEPVE